MAGIQTTHVGSLPRSKQITDLVFAREAGVPVEEEGFNRIVGAAVADIVAQQKAAGVDLPSDGEMSKISYATYIKDRLTGFAGDSARRAPKDLELVPGFLERADERRAVVHDPMLERGPMPFQMQAEQFDVALGVFDHQDSQRRDHAFASRLPMTL